jgi:hypothetical protein
MILRELQQLCESGHYTGGFGIHSFQSPTDSLDQLSFSQTKLFLDKDSFFKYVWDRYNWWGNGDEGTELHDLTDDPEMKAMIKAKMDAKVPKTWEEFKQLEHWDDFSYNETAIYMFI